MFVYFIKSILVTFPVFSVLKPKAGQADPVLGELATIPPLPPSSIKLKPIFQ
jgi:hypothetical protein